MEFLERTFHRLHPYVLSSSALFFASAGVGALLVHISPAFAERFLEEMEAAFGFLEKESSLELALFVFANNVLKTGLALLLGLLIGIGPVLFLVVNGVALGLVGSALTPELPFHIFLLGVLPHGAFEIPAVLLASSAGIMIGVQVLRRIRGTGGMPGEALHISLSFFLFLVVPLLLIAAFVESFVTVRFFSP